MGPPDCHFVDGDCRECDEFNKEYGKGRENPRMLLMQEHNRPDLYEYIQEKLQGNPRYMDLEDDDNGRDGFVDEITDAANGVFFWVYLAMLSFDEGFSSGEFDSIDDLKQRLDQLPNDLNEYFRKIVMRDIADESHEEAAQILSMASEASSTLSFIAYWFADQERKIPDLAFKLGAGPISPHRIAERRESMDQRLEACCKGLLEMQYEPLTDDEDMLLSSVLFSHKVDFLHHIVRDFLRLDDTRNTLRGWSSTPFDPHEGICKSLLAQMKIMPPDREYWQPEGPVSRLYDVFNYHLGYMISRSQEQSSLGVRLYMSVEAILDQRRVKFLKWSLPVNSSAAETSGGTERRNKLQTWWHKIRSSWRGRKA